ncbi:Kelch repeat-containing protein [candidate division KSB1 bacterium]
MLAKSITLLIHIILLNSPHLSAQESPDYTIIWKEKAKLPFNISNNSAAAVGSRIYTIGGRAENVQSGKFVFQYNIEDDKWERKTDMLTGRANLAAAVVGGKVYAIGGNMYKDTNERYDPETDSWESLVPMPTGRQHLNDCAAVIGGKIYIIGGFEAPEQRNTFGPPSAKNEVYDTETDTWEEKAPLPIPRDSPAVAGVNGKIYVIGGIGSRSEPPHVEIYDPASDKWEKGKRMPEKLHMMNYAVIADKIVVFGIREGIPFYKLFVYDTAVDKWGTVTQLPNKMRLAGITSANNKIYVISGGSSLNILEGTLTKTR